MMQANSIGIIIPTYEPDERFYSLLNVLLKYEYQVLVVDSSKTLNLKEKIGAYKIKYIKITQADFNHGATREFARKQIATPIVVMLTQDIVPASDDFIQKLVQPLVEKKAAVAYSRQLPRKEAKIMESFNRYYNYPERSHMRTLKDAATYGVYTFFCSNSCSAYRNEILDEIGGFQPTMTWEDYIATAKMLINGHTIAYVAEAQVYHSHNYNTLQELSRYFDAGYIRKQNSWLGGYIASAEKRGIGYTKELLMKVIKNDTLQFPRVMIMLFVKFVGYKLGYNYKLLPRKTRVFLSEQKYFWNSKFNMEN